MKKVICTLPNASELINDVKFVSHKDGMISEEVKDEVADFFASIPGYKIAGEKSPDDDTEAVMEALKARAAAVGLSVDARWKVDRLTAEVEKAEKAKAA